MKKTQRCVACRAAPIVFVPYVMERAELNDHYISRDERQWHALVCPTCGYHETYAADIAVLEIDEHSDRRVCRKCSAHARDVPLYDTYVGDGWRPDLVQVAPRKLGVTIAPQSKPPAVEIRGWGCTECGFVDSYARPDEVREEWQTIEGAALVGTLAPDVARMDPCRLCDEHDVVYVPRQLDRGFLSKNRTRVIAAVPVPWWHFRLNSNLDFVGELAACVCQACGHLESYVTRPDDVPWNKIAEARFLETLAMDDPDGPYR